MTSIDVRDAWKGVFGAAAAPGVGFAFHFDGLTVGPEFTNDWDLQITQPDTPGVSALILAHRSGLQVTRESRAFPGFDGIEYKLRFKNVGKTTLPSITEIQSICLSFALTDLGNISVLSSAGGLADAYLPPRNFSIRRHRFAPSAPTSGYVHLTTEGGRSSNKDLPFFLIHSETQQEGLFVAFGWSGQWEVFITYGAEQGSLKIWGKVPGLDLALASGEEIAGPTILIGNYQGSDLDGCNALRRLIRNEYTPKLDGKPFSPIATYNHWFHIEEWFDEPLLRALADAAAEIDQEYFLLDAGWFEHPGREEAGFVAGTGNWDKVHKDKFPKGLMPFAEYVRAKGLKLGLWFEPERVAAGTQLAEAHPDWILWQHGDDPEFPLLGWIRHLPKDHAYRKPRNGVLDYGRPEVQDWVCNLLDRYIREYDLKYIRYDCNIAPLPYWSANDQPGRHGLTQLKHVEGFYAVIDRVREAHPGTVLEGCASGGRRIDLETARRFHTFLISDQTVDPAIIRYHLHGINHFLPGNYHYIQYTQAPSPRHESFKPDDLGFQSLFAGAFGTGGHVDVWPEEMKERARRHVAVWKKIRRYLLEDYYPLSAQPDDLNSWSGWQFHDPKDQSGVIQTFRTETPDVKHRFVIYSIKERLRYRFTDAYSGEVFETMGAEAMTKGIEVAQPLMSSRVFAYQKISQ